MGTRESIGMAKSVSERWILRRCLTLLNYEAGILAVFLVPLLVLRSIEIALQTQTATLIGPLILPRGLTPVLFPVLAIVICGLLAPILGAIVLKVHAYPQGGITARGALGQALRRDLLGPLFLHLLLFTLLSAHVSLIMVGVLGGISIEALIQAGSLGDAVKQVTAAAALAVLAYVTSRLGLYLPVVVLERSPMERPAKVKSALLVALLLADAILPLLLAGILVGTLVFQEVMEPPDDAFVSFLVRVSSLLLIILMTAVGFWWSLRRLPGFARSIEMTRGRTRQMLPWVGTVLFGGWLIGQLPLGAFIAPLLTVPLFYMAATITYLERAALAPAPDNA